MNFLNESNDKHHIVYEQEIKKKRERRKRKVHKIE